MVGCEACSALVGAGDVFCATCGADLRQSGARKAARSATARVAIPVRRYGRAPPPPGSLRSAAREHADRNRRVLLAALLSVGIAGALVVLLQFW